MLLAYSAEEDAYGIAQLVLTFAALPLQDGRYHLRLGVAIDLVGALYNDFVILTEGLFTVFCYLKVNINGGIADNGSDSTVRFDNLLIVGTQKLYFSALNRGNGKLASAHELRGNGQVVGNLLSILPHE